MKKLGCLLLLILLAGCATGSLEINPEYFQSLQYTQRGEPTDGCIATNLNASSGVVGGTNRTIITWGDLDEATISWCIGR